MNNGYYQTSPFPGIGLNNNTVPNQQTVPSYEQNNTFSNNNILEEQSYIENILRMNKGKKAKFYITIPGSNEWQDKVFEGKIEQAGRDHIIISNEESGQWYLLLMIYLNFVTFDEPINFIKNFN